MLPNILSLARIFCGPLVMLLVAQGSLTALIATILVMLLAEISDLMDGHLARKLNVTSAFGKIVDPLADSLYRALVFLAFMDAGWMPAWMVAVIVSRDILVSYLRIFSEQHGVTMGARQSGKIKAVFQGVVQIGTVVLVIVSGGALVGVYETLVFSILLVATLVTAWSGHRLHLGLHPLGGSSRRRRQSRLMRRNWTMARHLRARPVQTLTKSKPLDGRQPITLVSRSPVTRRNKWMLGAWNGAGLVGSTGMGG